MRSVCVLCMWLTRSCPSPEGHVASVVRFRVDTQRVQLPRSFFWRDTQIVQSRAVHSIYMNELNVASQIDRSVSMIL